MLVFLYILFSETGVYGRPGAYISRVDIYHDEGACAMKRLALEPENRFHSNNLICSKNTEGTWSPSASLAHSCIKGSIDLSKSVPSH